MTPHHFKLSPGSRAVLYGERQILFHQLRLALAHAELFGTLPSPASLLTFVLRDAGFCGVHDLSGEETGPDSWPPALLRRLGLTSQAALWESHSDLFFLEAWVAATHPVALRALTAQRGCTRLTVRAFKDALAHERKLQRVQRRDVLLTFGRMVRA